MNALMLSNGGIGLAGNQAGYLKRIFVHGLLAAPSPMLNPVASKPKGRMDLTEGCLSLALPEARGVVPRYAEVQLDFRDYLGMHWTVTAREYLAQIAQHELDHLDGIEYVQRMEGAERDRVYALMNSAGVDTGLLPRINDKPIIGGALNGSL